MRTKEQLIELIEFAKEQGMRKIEIDGVTFYTETAPGPKEVPDLTADEIVKPASVFDDLSEDEILFWSTPYYDDLQVRKDQQKQKLTGE